MKIVMIGPGYPYRGGLAQFNHQLYHHLSRRHAVTFLTFTRQYPELLFPGKTQLDTSREKPPVPTIRVLDTINPLTYWKTFRLIEAINPDIVLYRYWMPFFAPAFGTIVLLTHLKRVAKTVFLCDNIVPHERRPGDRWLTRYAFRYVDGFVVMSQQVENELQMFKPRAPYVRLFHPIFQHFPPPVTRQQALAKLNLPNKPTLLFFGFVRHYKGLDVLLHSLQRIRQKLDCQLIVAGEFYDDEAEYRQLIKALGLTEAVRLFNRYIPNEDVPYFFSAADVVVLPYRSATQSGIVPVCYYYQKPVIASAVGGLPEVVEPGKTGFLVPPEDPEALAEAILTFYEQGGEKAFQHGLQRARDRFSWEAFTRQLEDFLERL